MRRSHVSVMVFLIGHCNAQTITIALMGCCNDGVPTVMWPGPVARSCDYISRSHDFFPTVMWPVLGGQKIWLCKQVTWSGHVTFSHGHMSFFGSKKVDYIIKSHDQIPTVMWPGFCDQVGNWTHNPNLVISLCNQKSLLARKFQINPKKF